MNARPAKALTPAARALRTEIICRPATLFTRTAPYRALARRTPAVDPQGDAAHLIAAVRDAAPSQPDADAVLARVVASLPRRALDDMGVSAEDLTEALIASRPYEPVYA